MVGNSKLCFLLSIFLTHLFPTHPFHIFGGIPPLCKICFLFYLALCQATLPQKLKQLCVFLFLASRANHLFPVFIFCSRSSLFHHVEQPLLLALLQATQELTFSDGSIFQLFNFFQKIIVVQQLSGSQIFQIRLLCLRIFLLWVSSPPGVAPPSFGFVSSLSALLLFGIRVFGLALCSRPFPCTTW